MTQEELDALMNADDLDGINSKEGDGAKDELSNESFDENSFRAEADREWPPPPPNKEHKVVHQLDDVTRDTEAKAGEVFDQLDIVDSSANKIIESAKKLKEIVDSQSKLLQTLHSAFPNVKTFSKSIEDINKAQKLLDDVDNNAQGCCDATLQAMDLMQFQDINRQRIERVINVMRALSKYMNSLFESKIDDTKRVSSAVFIPGDKNDDMADNDEIEHLIATFGQKK